VSTRLRDGLAEPDGHVYAVRDQIAHVFARDHLEYQVRMHGQKTPDLARKDQAREIGVDVDAEASLDRACRSGDRVGRILDRGKQRSHLLVEPLPFIGQRDRPRRPVQKAYPQAFFKPGDRAADARRGDT
jgi:hypothetical protein